MAMDSVSNIAWPDLTSSIYVQSSLQTIVDNTSQLAWRRVGLLSSSPCRLAHDDHVGGSLVVQTPGTAAASPCDRNTDLRVANWACCRPSRPRALVDDPSAIAQPLVSTNRAIQALPLPMPIDTIVAGASSSSSSSQSPFSTLCPALPAAARTHSTAGPPNCRATATGRVVSCRGQGAA